MNEYDSNSGIEVLAKLLEEQKLIILTGSGISVDSGLPTWDQLLNKFIDFCKNIQDDIQLPSEDRFDELLSQAEAEKDRYPIRVASVLKQRLIEIEKKRNANVTKIFREWLLDLFFKAEPNENHKAIVGTNYPYILTTNYDNLLEEASKILNFRQLFVNSFTFDDAEKVGGAIYSKIPAIIHIHGDRTNIFIDDFVFTAEDYVRIRKKYPGFTLSLKTLFLSYSVLFVGYGGSDPHLEDLIEDLLYLWGWSDSPLLPNYFLLLKKEKSGHVLKDYKRKLRTKIIEIDDYAETKIFLQKLRDKCPR